MGLLRRSLAMLLVLIWIFWLPKIRAQSVGSSLSSTRALDALLQDYAYGAFLRPRTGIVYDGDVPSNLTGINISAMRLRSGSFRRKGASYKEFEIPVGVNVRPYVERLVLVYQNLGNWSTIYYPLQGYKYLAPVLGLLAYDASNLSAKHLPELDMKASGQPISIKFSDAKLVPDSSAAKCVRFELDGSVNFSNVLSGNICSTYQQGHFSIVVESAAPAPSPIPVAPAPPGGGANKQPTSSGKKNNNNVGIIVGSVLGGLALLILLGFLVMWARKYQHRKKMQQMENAAETGEALHMTSVGNTKAPSATVTRTQPTLESEYVA